MIDYTKIWVLDKTYINEVFSNALLKKHKIINSYQDKYNKVNYIKTHKGVKFKFNISDGEITRLEILIKPHYYYNNNLHNGNVFSYKKCIKVYKELKKTFKIPSNALVINIEYGLNLIVLGYSYDIVNAFAFYERKSFYSSNEDLPYCKVASKIDKKGKSSLYKQFKVYWKYEFDVLRIELRSKKSKFINNRLSIKYYDDLLKMHVYGNFAETLIEEFKKVLLLDLKNDMSNLSENEKNKFEKYLNPNTWNEYLNKSRNVFTNHKKAYFKLLEKTENNIYYFLMDSINASLDDIFEV